MRDSPWDEEDEEEEDDDRGDDMGRNIFDGKQSQHRLLPSPAVIEVDDDREGESDVVWTLAADTEVAGRSMVEGGDGGIVPATGSAGPRENGVGDTR